ncbi:hypothetical protein C4569_01210 [Candidatus Parcubacteria bacterium]|nr:MAG: hypothetical protein C4569_01210 [Candidatus Parcubacteria bacterium]
MPPDYNLPMIPDILLFKDNLTESFQPRLPDSTRKHSCHRESFPSFFIVFIGFLCKNIDKIVIVCYSKMLYIKSHFFENFVIWHIIHYPERGKIHEGY